MIRFLDTDVFAVQKAEVDRTYVRRHFFRKGHMDDILVVYEGETYDGYITYDSYLKSANSGDEEGYIFREKYILMSNDESIWMDLKELFAGTGNEDMLIPLFNVQGEMLYFAYDDKRNGNQALQTIVESVLEEMEEMDKKILQDFFSDVYPKVRGVRIYNLNEWGYRFYKIMKNCGYQVQTLGEKWEVLFPGITCGEEIPVPETALMNVYAEGTEVVCVRRSEHRQGESGAYWLANMYSISSNYYNWAEKQFIRKCKGLHFLKVTVPKKKDVEFRIIGEDICKFSTLEAFEVGSPEQVTYCQKVYGRKITWEEWKSLCEDKEAESVYIAGKEVKIKYFGDKANRKIYVIGPCIVEGVTVPDDKESFLYCIYKELENRGEKYFIVGIVVPESTKPNLFRQVLDSLTIREGDMVVSIYEDFGTYTYTEGYKLNLAETYNKRKEYWFYEIPAHTNYAGNRAIAKTVADSILSNAEETREKYRGGGICGLAKERLAHRSIRQWSNISGRCRISSFRELGRGLVQLS